MYWRLRGHPARWWGGELLASRAANAFTDAFNITNLVSVAIAIAAEAVVAVTFGKRREQEAAAAAFGATDRASKPVAPSDIAAAAIAGQRADAGEPVTLAAD